MTDVQLTFRILSWWHAGTGRGETGNLDALIARDADDLPYLPGRTVKGLLRDAYSQWEYWQHGGSSAHQERTTRLFGTRTDLGGERTRYDTEPGVLRVSSARLLPHVRRAIQEENLLAALSDSVRSTAIDPGTGAARDRSLRVTEVAVPMTLVARVADGYAGREGGPDPWVEELREALGFLQGVGANRHRGFGRADVALERIAVQERGNG